ncbi:hypothetical protein [Burkholderia phage BCSR52]|jgi:hypothetical protein|uniref:Uncharacterized protein n=1 Tax=Burkholderia phage BCSR52 TaxID=2805748 RepID=A0A889IQB2_9CAUD|nr:hypothetical protein [Burkholderia phage BCSR52]DAP64248.1 MAG TPA: hypothetical protein [Caudoviricetes sp.]
MNLYYVWNYGNKVAVLTASDIPAAVQRYRDEGGKKCYVTVSCEATNHPSDVCVIYA